MKHISQNGKISQVITVTFSKTFVAVNYLTSSRGPKIQICAKQVKVRRVQFSNVSGLGRIFDHWLNFPSEVKLLNCQGKYRIFAHTVWLPSATVVAERLCFHRCLSVHWGGLHLPGQAGITPRAEPPSPGDGHCSGRYASYWNAFLLKIFPLIVNLRAGGNPYLKVVFRKKHPGVLFPKFSWNYDANIKEILW